jgi:hypothetical protein
MRRIPQPRIVPMPLSEAAPRKHLHTRDIKLHGYQRDDGQFDVDAEIIDTKAYAFEIDGRPIAVGDPLHHMRARLTFTENLVITAAEAVTEAGPFTLCIGGAGSFSRLVGLTIRPGFLRAANERLGGIIGCTHIRELLQQMATVAFQTTYPVRANREVKNPAAPPRLLNTCHAYNSAGDVIKRRSPAFYTGG